MFTFSGRWVEPYKGSPNLEDVAIGLGRICRFAGSCRVFYPVLLHSMLVADLVDERLEFPALLHDAIEVLTSDIPKPFKLPELKALEESLSDRFFAEQFSVTISHEDWKAIKIADNDALSAEARLIGAPGLSNLLPAPRIVALRHLVGYLSRYSFKDCVEPHGRAVLDFIGRVGRSRGTFTERDTV